MPGCITRPSRNKSPADDGSLIGIFRVDPATLFDGPYKVAANLPYHVTSPLLRHLLTSGAKPDVIVVMVQKEVAERIAAKPGDTSLLSVMVQLYSNVSLIRDVPASAFYPPPQVDSAVLKLEVYTQLPVEVDDPEAMLRMVAAGFSRRRKQIHNSLSESMWFPPAAVHEVLDAAGIEPTRRAQTLSLDEWSSLHRAYEASKSRWTAEGRQ